MIGTSHREVETHTGFEAVCVWIGFERRRIDIQLRGSSSSADSRRGGGAGLIRRRNTSACDRRASSFARVEWWNRLNFHFDGWFGRAF